MSSERAHSCTAAPGGRGPAGAAAADPARSPTGGAAQRPTSFTSSERLLRQAKGLLAWQRPLLRPLGARTRPGRSRSTLGGSVRGSRSPEARASALAAGGGGARTAWAPPQRSKNSRESRKHLRAAARASGGRESATGPGRALAQRAEPPVSRCRWGVRGCGGQAGSGRAQGVGAEQDHRPSGETRGSRRWAAGEKEGDR